MQASQSGTASDLLAADLNSIANSKPDPKLDSTSTRSFPSPFSAPILAARKYFERRETGPARHGNQQNGGPQNGNQHNGSQQNVSQQNGSQQNGDPRRDGTSAEGTLPREHQLVAGDQTGKGYPGGDELRREQIRREQDRRLERSLYEEHSIETATDLAETRAAEASHQLFSSAPSGPLPDPEAVRGAIQRLARGPELRRDPVRSFGVPGRAGSGPPAAEQGHAAALHPVRIEPSSLEPPLGPEQFNADSLNLAPASFRPASFGDVARRVWSAHSAAEYPEPGPREQPDAVLRSAAAVSPRQSGDDASQVYGGYGAAGLRVQDLRGQDAWVQDAWVQDAQVQDARVQDAQVQDARVQVGAETPAAAWDSSAEKDHPHPGSVATARLAGREMPAGPSGLEQDGFKPSRQREAEVPVRTPAEISGAAGDSLALAHDACNLLSALALYSELLASPGVLGEQHRHYAEELKLMAGRSQRLIDRLLCEVAGRKEIAQFAEGPGEARNSATEASAGRGAEDTAQAEGQVSATERIDAPRTGAAAAQADHAEPAIASSPAPAGEVLPGAEAGTGDAPATSLVHLLMRWRSLLSALAQGRLEVVFGEHADTPVPAGAEALERILVNLVRNACAATSRGGSIRIGVGLVEAGEGEAGMTEEGMTETGAPSPAAQTLALTVDDSGCGMNQAQIRRILNTRQEAAGQGSLLAAGQTISGGEGRSITPVADPAVGVDRRHGLGLQIVRGLAEASGGTLSIQSWPGRGTRVEIRWPVMIRSAAETPVAAVPVIAISAAKASVTDVPDTRIAAAAIPATEPDLLKPEPAKAASANTPEADRSQFAAADSDPQPLPHDASRIASQTASRVAAPLPSLSHNLAEIAEPSVSEVSPPAGTPAGIAPVFGPVAASAVPEPIRHEAEPLRQDAGEAVGPDGFSEAELRAMMLRLHRTFPRERALAGKGLPGWAPDARQPDERGSDLREADLHFGISGFGIYGPAAQRPGPGNAAQSERAAKGAIAC